MNDPVKPDALAKRESTSVEYIPFGANDKVKLNVAIVQNLIAVKTRSGKTCTDRDAIKFLALCQAKRLNPFEGDAYLIGYDGKEGPSFSLITAHQTYLKRAELHPEYDGMESGVVVRDSNNELVEIAGDFVDDGQELVGGWCRVHFKTRKFPMYKRVKLARFRKSFGVWVDDPAGMIVKCAEADALRSSFPTMLGGLYMREEIAPAMPDIAKPDFGSSSAPAMFALPAENGSKPAESAPQPEPEPEAPAGRSGGFNALKAVRNLCKMANITEAEVLGWLEATGKTDGSQGGLDEVPSAVLTALSDGWADKGNTAGAATVIKAARSGKDML